MKTILKTFLVTVLMVASVSSFAQPRTNINELREAHNNLQCFLKNTKNVKEKKNILAKKIAMEEHTSFIKDYNPTDLKLLKMEATNWLQAYKIFECKEKKSLVCTMVKNNFNMHVNGINVKLNKAQDSDDLDRTEYDVIDDVIAIFKKFVTQEESDVSSATKQGSQGSQGSQGRVQSI